MVEAIGADLVVFQTLPDLIASVRLFNLFIFPFDCSVFTGGGFSKECFKALIRVDNVKDSGFRNGENIAASSGPINSIDGLRNTWNVS